MARIAKIGPRSSKSPPRPDLLSERRVCDLRALQGPWGHCKAFKSLNNWPAFKARPRARAKVPEGLGRVLAGSKAVKGPVRAL